MPSSLNNLECMWHVEWPVLRFAWAFASETVQNSSKAQ